MNIGSYGLSSYRLANAAESFKDMKDSLNTFQAQLGTGKKADTYAGLGATGAAVSLRLNAKLTTLNGYANAITDANNRVDIASNALTSIATTASKLAGNLSGAPVSDLLTRQYGETTAAGDLSLALDALNIDINGRYLFSGRAADTAPTSSGDYVLNGDATHAGLKALVSERGAADLGSTGLGRLQAPTLSGNTVTLAEETAAGPFGFKLGAATPVTGTGITTSIPAGPPAAVALNVVAQPNDGDAVSLDLNLPDGTTQTLLLTAKTNADPASTDGSFAIGASAAATAANLQAALDRAVRSQATTTLQSASAVKTATDFFAGSKSNPPPRVVPPVAPATDPSSLSPGSAANTVIWYQGDDANDSARATASVQVSDSQSVAIGARANEPALQTVLAALGALAASSFPESDSTTPARYDAISGRVANLLQQQGSPGVQTMVSDLGNASATIGLASDRVAATKAQVQNALDPVENASPEEVAAQLMQTQTRLQASYQATSTIAKLSLVDYL